MRNVTYAEPSQRRPAAVGHKAIDGMHPTQRHRTDAGGHKTARNPI